MLTGALKLNVVFIRLTLSVHLESIFMRLTGAFFALPLLAGMFFSGNSQAWSRVEDFNDGATGQSVQATGAMDDAAGGTRYSNEQSLDGSLVAKMSIEGGVEGFGAWGGILNFPSKLTSGDSFWVQFYMYIPSGFSISTPGNGSLKFLRVRTTTPGGGNGGFNDFQMMDDNTNTDAVYRFIKEGVANGPDYGWFNIASADERGKLLPKGRWFKVELALRFGVSPMSEGGSSYVRLWVDDNLVWNGTSVQTLAGSGDVADALYMFTYWNGYAPKSQSLYIDNLIMRSDMPSNRDSRGFAYIGDRGIVTGNGETSPPAPVESLSIE